MKIAFGWYSFNLKSYSANDLALDIDEWRDSTFEVRQKVFHLFWIPVFSLGKIYAARKQGKLHDLPETVIGRIKEKGKVKTPWYSFLLPILALLIPIIAGVYIYIAESVMRHDSYQNDKEQYEAAITNVQTELQKLSLNAYLKLFNTEKPSDEIILLKLVKIKNNRYSFIIKKINFPQYEREKYFFEDIAADTLTFTKKQLQSAICRDYKIIKERKPYGVNFLGNEKYVIEDIEYFDQPVIDGNIDWKFLDVIRPRKFHYYNSKFTGYKNERSWNFQLQFQNFGAPVNLVQIQNVENNLQWPDSLPKAFKTYEYLNVIYIQANTTSDPDTLKFKARFIFEDALKNKYEYIVKGNESWYEIVQKSNR